MDCERCHSTAKFRCGATPGCSTLYCSQDCRDSHICTPFQYASIGAHWNDLPLDVITNLLMRMPMDQLWRLCSTERRIRDLCQDKTFRINYLIVRDKEEVQKTLTDALKKRRCQARSVIL